MVTLNGTQYVFPDMSVYSNPAHGANNSAAAYITAVLELIGDRDPINVLKSTAAWCAACMRDLTTRQLTTPEAPGKWSIAGVMQHFADSELVWGYRLRKVLAEERPELTGYDQDAWADSLGYENADADKALEMFTALRGANLRLLNSASDSDLDRVGVHVERGEESVRHMIRLYAGHDLVHRRQMERISTFLI